MNTGNTLTLTEHKRKLWTILITLEGQRIVTARTNLVVADALAELWSARGATASKRRGRKLELYLEGSLDVVGFTETLLRTAEHWPELTHEFLALTWRK